MKKLIAHLILVGNFSKVDLVDWLRYFWNSLKHFAPVAYILSGLGLWFADNKQFLCFMLFALLTNAVVGIVRHKKFKTYNPRICLYRNLEVGFAVVCVFSLLEMLRIMVGHNIAGDSFRILIQVMTFLYPTSKVFKNIFILSKGKFPPKTIMDKLYTFEKNGDLSEFFTKKTDK